MEIAKIIADVLIALFAFIGGIATVSITQKHTDKRQTEEINANKQHEVHEEIAESDKKHNSDIQMLRGDFGELKDMFAELQASYKNTITVISLKIDALEKAQNKHNDVITRTFIVEKDIEVLKNREKVSEHRLEDLEKRIDKINDNQK